jgi:hypothetical protein
MEVVKVNGGNFGQGDSKWTLMSLQTLQRLMIFSGICEILYDIGKPKYWKITFNGVGESMAKQ